MSAPGRATASASSRTHPCAGSSRRSCAPGNRAPARGRPLLWTDDFVRFPKVAVRQDGSTLTRRTLPWPAAPDRVFRIPSDVLDDVSPTGGPVRIAVGQPASAPGPSRGVRTFPESVQASLV
ncbi:hypothetical protein GCM10027162_21670 [Streptomyces incanus]